MDHVEDDCQVRFAYRHEWQEAMELVWKTFLKFESEDYTSEGIDSFNDFITDTTLHKMFLAGTYQMFCAVKDNRIVGIITLRNGNHISLLFVEEAYHKQGIGKALVYQLAEYLMTEHRIDTMTVNASPYAVEFYHKCGFIDLGPEAQNKGIRYTPMVFYI